HLRTHCRLEQWTTLGGQGHRDEQQCCPPFGTGSSKRRGSHRRSLFPLIGCRTDTLLPRRLTSALQNGYLRPAGVWVASIARGGGRPRTNRPQSDMRCP